MRVSNPLANSYTKNQADNKFITVDLEDSTSGEANKVNADLLNGQEPSHYLSKVFINSENSTGQIYNNTFWIEPITAGDILQIKLQREGSFWTPNVVVYSGGSMEVVLACFAMNKTGANIFTKCTITQYSVSIGEWWNSIEYSGNINQDLCTGIQIDVINLAK